MRPFSLPGIAALMLAAGIAGAAGDAIVVGAFSSARPGGALPPDWEPLLVRGVERRTVYALVESQGATVLRAEARASASGLVRRLRATVEKTPLLKWRWKVANVLGRSDIRRKAGDDFPARVYVLFDYPVSRLSFAERAGLLVARALDGGDVPAATLCYVWDGGAPAGTIFPSAYTRRVRMIVVESGAARVGRWVTVERDVAADFRAAFGEEAPPIAGIAIAADTDNTGESAVAWFGDISLHPRPEATAGSEPTGVN